MPKDGYLQSSADLGSQGLEVSRSSVPGVCLFEAIVQTNLSLQVFPELTVLCTLPVRYHRRAL